MQSDEYKYLINIISKIRDSFIGSQEVYTKGSCYQFYLILRSIFPTAVPYYNQDHIITKISNRYFDILGEVKKVDNYYLMRDKDELSLSLHMPFNIYKNNN